MNCGNSANMDVSCDVLLHFYGIKELDAINEIDEQLTVSRFLVHSSIYDSTLRTYWQDLMSFLGIKPDGQDGAHTSRRPVCTPHPGQCTVSQLDLSTVTSW
jgi:hypothetical protein